MIHSKDIKDLHPYVKGLAEKFLAKCKEAGLNVIVTQTYRDAEYQNYLYAQGRTRPGNIVTNCRAGYSPHNYRLAFDICVLDADGKADWNNIVAFKKAGAIGKSVGLKWGGDFKSFVDYPHFEYLFGLTIRDLLNGKRPPVTVPQPSRSKPTIPKLTRVLEIGYKGNNVRTLQTLLNKKINAGLKIDGDFGNKTLVAVRKFQSVNGLEVDGIVGVKTWSKLVG